MKLRGWLGLLISIGLALPLGVSSAEVTTPTAPETAIVETLTDEVALPVVPLHAVAGKNKVAVIGRNVLFDASGSTGPNGATLTYTWDFGDGQQFEGIDASHIYQEPGTYRARVTVRDGVNTSKASLAVTVAQDVAILITDGTLSKDTVRDYRLLAQQHGALLVVITASDSGSDFLTERSLTDQLIASIDDITQANLILVMTEKSIGLNALSAVGRILSSSNTDTTSTISFGQKIVVQANEKLASGTFVLLAQSAFDVIKPRYVILTTNSAVKTILNSSDTTTIINRLRDQNYDYQLLGRHSERAIGQLTPINFLSYSMNYLVNQGVNPDDLFLILILPVVATIISFARQVIGIKAFGIFVPTIMTLAFIVTQLKYGLAIFAVLLITATLTRIVARYLKLLYLPRMAIVLTVVSFSIVVMFMLASYFDRPTFLTISIFPILMMIMLTESFVEAQIEQGNRSAIIITLETLALAVVSYSVVTWDWFATFIMSYPEAILLTILINFILGRFTGLRLTEYLRFRQLIKPIKPS